MCLVKTIKTRFNDYNNHFRFWIFFSILHSWEFALENKSVSVILLVNKTEYYFYYIRLKIYFCKSQVSFFWVKIKYKKKTVIIKNQSNSCKCKNLFWILKEHFEDHSLIFNLMIREVQLSMNKQDWYELCTYNVLVHLCLCLSTYTYTYR